MLVKSHIVPGLLATGINAYAIGIPKVIIDRKKASLRTRYTPGAIAKIAFLIL